MSKKLRKDPLMIASDIVGWLDDNYTPKVFDNRNAQWLDPHNIDDKIIIYERQVNDWFLHPAKNLLRYKNSDKQFIVLMICISYLEGVQQYREGESSENQSKYFFRKALHRIYPNQFNDKELNHFYKNARCGLFHTGMTSKAVILDNSFHKSLEFDGWDIKISPTKLLRDIEKDFKTYIEELKIDPLLGHNFDRMFSNTF